MNELNDSSYKVGSSVSKDDIYLLQAYKQPKLDIRFTSYIADFSDENVHCASPMFKVETKVS
jgi:hypothetical protein